MIPCLKWGKGSLPLMMGFASNHVASLYVISKELGGDPTLNFNPF